MSYGTVDPLYDANNSESDNSLYDIDHGATDSAIAQASNPDTTAAVAGDQSIQDAIDRNKHIGEPYPGDLVAANQGPGTINRLDATGTSVLPGATPQTFIKRLDDGSPAPPAPSDSVVSTTPGVSSGASGLPGISSGGHQLSDAEWQKDFENKFGYFDPRYNSRENMLANAQHGDQQIRGVGGTGGGDQLAYMAGLDSDANRVLGGINAHPDFYRSQLAADEGVLHNAEIQNRIAAGEFAQAAGGGAGGQGFNGKLGGAPQGGGGLTQNLAALQNLQSQQYHTPAGGVIPDSQAFPDGTKIVGELAQLKGVTLANDPIDGYGNIVFSENGQTRHIPMNQWADWGPVIEARLAAQNAPPPAATGGGGGGYGGGRSYPSRGYGGGGGGGGGNAPAAAAPFGPADLYGPNPPNMAGYGPLDANRFGQYGNTNVMPTQSVMPSGGYHIDPELGLLPDIPSPFVTGSNPPGWNPDDVTINAPGNRYAGEPIYLGGGVPPANNKRGGIGPK